jgi:hypothetical protein
MKIRIRPPEIAAALQTEHGHVMLEQRLLPTVAEAFGITPTVAKNTK